MNERLNSGVNVPRFKNVEHFGVGTSTSEFGYYTTSKKNYVSVRRSMKSKHKFKRVRHVVSPCRAMLAFSHFYKRAVVLKDIYYEQCLRLPIYPTLADSEQQYVIETIIEITK